MSERYDLVVVGGGSGGLTAATIAAKLRARVLLVDRTRLGGDCLWDGCVPSKALIASARLAHQMRRAHEYGLATSVVDVDFSAVMARIRGVQRTIEEHESVAAMQAIGVDVRLGGARFIDSHTLQIGDEARVHGQRFIISTGSRAVAPPIPGLEEAGYINHVSVFKLEKLPPRMAILGGGPVGVEMAQALQRLGAQVTLLQSAERLLVREELEVSNELAKALRRDGVNVVCGAQTTRVDKEGGAKAVTFAVGNKTEVLRVDEILVAVGRRPNLEPLQLGAAGVATNERGIVVDNHLRTSQPHIFAVGDCTGGPQFTHWAEHEARIATRNALFVGSEKRSMEIVPWVTFTDPEVARVGLTEAEAKLRVQKAHAHCWEFARLDRALTEGEPGGFIKVVVDGNDRVLGAHIIGHNGGEALGEWVLALQHGLRLGDVASAIHAYPTISRINRRVGDTAFLDHGIPGWLTRIAARYRPRRESDNDARA